MITEKKTIQILVLTRYERLGASSRLRILQYIPHLERKNINFQVQSFFTNSDLEQKYSTGKYSFLTIVKSYLKRIFVLLRKNKFDLIWIEKEALPWIPYIFEKILLKNKPYILDIDDAWFHIYDLHKNFLVRYFLGNRLDMLMRESSTVICGNKYLQERAFSALAKNVKIIPTVVDLDRYNSTKLVTNKNDNNENVTSIVWIGSPSTVKYLDVISKTLIKLSQKTRIKLIVIGATYHLQNIDVSCIKWSEDTEIYSIKLGDIGIMPLYESAWESGKCGYKLIQYMACSLPVIGSPVGVNTEIIEHSKNGFLASTEDEWESYFKILISDINLQKKYGDHGFKTVEEKYSLSSQVEKIEAIIRDSLN